MGIKFPFTGVQMENMIFYRLPLAYSKSINQTLSQFQTGQCPKPINLAPQTLGEGDVKTGQCPKPINLAPQTLGEGDVKR